MILHEFQLEFVEICQDLVRVSAGEIRHDSVRVFAGFRGRDCSSIVNGLTLVSIGFVARLQFNWERFGASTNKTIFHKVIAQTG